MVTRDGGAGLSGGWAWSVPGLQRGARAWGEGGGRAAQVPELAVFAGVKRRELEALGHSVLTEPLWRVVEEVTRVASPRPLGRRWSPRPAMGVAAGWHRDAPGRGGGLG